MELIPQLKMAASGCNSLTVYSYSTVLLLSVLLAVFTGTNCFMHNIDPCPCKDQTLCNFITKTPQKEVGFAIFFNRMSFRVEQTCRQPDPDGHNKACLSVYAQPNPTDTTKFVHLSVLTRIKNHLPVCLSVCLCLQDNLTVPPK